MKLIDRQAAIDLYKRDYEGRYAIINAEQFEAMLTRVSSAQPDPKTGRWKPYPIADGCIQCSVCGILRMGEPSNFCPNCGADMRGEHDE